MPKFDEVTEGQELPGLTKKPPLQQLVWFAAGSGDFNPLHYDFDFAKNMGLQGPIIHGRFKYATLGQLIWEWVQPDGRIKSFECQYRGMDEPNKELQVSGVVKRKWQEGGENLVEVEIWTQDAEGKKTTPGSAVVTLP
jgi:acyl dehydratase